jgi:hypothetical protein
VATQRFTAEQVVAAIIETRGIVTWTAVRLGCTRGTVRNYAARYPDVARALYEERERLVDSAELRLIEAVERGELQAIVFTLKTIGRHRGYG